MTAILCKVYTHPRTQSTPWVRIAAVCLALAGIAYATPADAARALLTTEPRTDIRIGPTREHRRVTVLPPGITIWADDFSQGFYRVALTSSLQAWVEQSHVRPLDRSVPRPPVQDVADYAMSGIDAGTILSLEIPSPIAYRVTQHLEVPALTLDLYGVRLAEVGTRQFPEDPCVWAVEAVQVADDWARLNIHLTFKQHRGWRVVQSDGHLQMLVRRPYYGASLAGKVIVIDPGHGGSDSGAVGPTGVREKDVNLRIALRLERLLIEQGAIPRLLRRSDVAIGPPGCNQRQELEARLAASEHPDSDFFLSIHNNAVGSGNRASAYGTETYYWTPMSALPARLMQKHLCAHLKTKNRLVAWQQFYVMRWGDVPRVLVECAYVSNRAEEARMRTDAFTESAARALMAGLQEFFALAAHDTAPAVAGIEEEVEGQAVTPASLQDDEVQ
jgi:N-acetylmuramoyl-L-alanine amidase